MKNFFRLAEGLDVIPLLHAVYKNFDLWNQNKRRTDFGGHEEVESPHKDVDDILLRFSNNEGIGDQLVCENTPAFARLPQARPLVFALMARVEGTILGRVMITKLAPGQTITPHADTAGKYANYFSRYHIPLQSGPGTLFRADDELVQMKPGEVWDFNAHAEHEVINNSTVDRIHLIVDIKS